MDSTPWIPVATAVTAAGAALGAQGIAGRIQRRNQERTEGSQRRERAAEVLAEVRAFLTDAHPDRLAFNAGEDRSEKTLTDLRERRERIRIPLLTLAGSHPFRKVRDLARRLEIAMANTLTTGHWLVSDLLQYRGDLLENREEAKRNHEEASSLLDELLEAIQEA